MRARAIILLAALLASGCVQLSWQRVNVNAPVPDAGLAQLQPGRSELGDCLRALGAPTEIWESNGGVVLAYGWLDEGGWGVSASYAFARFVSASIRFDDSDRNFQGVVLVLDRDLRLQSVRRGFLNRITSDLRRPTTVVE